MAFMDKLGEIGDAISSKGKEAANKAKEMNGVSSLKAKISTAENGIKTVYAELGEKMFAEHADWIRENCPEMFEKVGGLQAEIEQYNNEIEELKRTTANANAAIQEAQKARAARAAADAAAKKAAAAQAAAERARAAAEQTATGKTMTETAEPVQTQPLSGNTIDVEV